ncbi:hypothetical protein BDN70DRAFT_918535 [Pholiota conissans]|uniref:Heterokaryon incompatibility domain-containing protein n=1 Tax=Pholiota conissans TaxID=109636 RepID=A0A9P6CWU7_9AGAR|nr:hypothetical protein BDN70DRAFT_918535 [Pholiota conissans]
MAQKPFRKRRPSAPTETLHNVEQTPEIQPIAQPNSNEKELDSGQASTGNTEGTKTHASLLLTALRNVIIPLVKAAVSQSSKDLDEDAEDVLKGREGENLLSALQKYISGVIRDGTKARVVDFKELSEDVETSKKADNNEVATTQANEGLKLGKSPDVAEDMVIFRITAASYREKVSLAEVLASLRERVFNELPIRLLFFHKSDTDSSKLQISLVERGGVYAFLEQKFLKSLVTRHEEIPNTYVASYKDHPIYAGCRYAILSHTWLCSSPEVTYDDWRNGNLDLSHEGYKKLVNFCNVAEADYGLTFGWMDTVCIDKSSSSELDESIRSMYKWYRNATICITYLEGTSATENMASDRWFTRGWTLQELIAPRRLKFYNCNWKKLLPADIKSDKSEKDIRKIIWQATGILPDHLDPSTISHISISNKLRWAAKRQVTRGEDTAYSLMGLFGVNMSIAYGEGVGRAFSRLLNEILITTSNQGIVDVFNFGGGHVLEGYSMSGKLLPASPKPYLFRSDFQYSTGPLIEPLTITHLGLRIPVLLLPAAVGTPNSEEYTPIGNYFSDPVSYATVDVDDTKSLWSTFPTCLNILDINSADETGSKWMGTSFRCVVAVLNCAAAPDDMDIRIPSRCLACAYVRVLDSLDQEIAQVNLTTKLKKVPTMNPITFQLYNKSMPEFDKEFYTVPRSELPLHGMRFLTMYL